MLLVFYFGIEFNESNCIRALGRVKSTARFTRNIHKHGFKRKNQLHLVLGVHGPRKFAVYASRGPPSLGFGSQVYKILIFAYDFANVGMKRNFTIFLCTCIIKFVLEYAQIARSEPKSMIRDIEGLSNV